MSEELEKLGKYSIKSILGKGNMGVVYEGFDADIERKVALKTIHKNLLEGDGGDQFVQRFKREAQSAGRLMHQNIVAVYEYGMQDGTPFIAMEFIQGKELKDYIKDDTRFDMGQIQEIMGQTLDAMQYVHDAGVVHRDMKPANIILLENNRVKVADFGIARVENSTMTQLGTVMGTPRYMSPEQFMGQRVDHRSDLFSMAVILYELLTGEAPFPGKGMSTIMQKVLYTEPHPPCMLNNTIPRAFDPVLRKALSKRPDERFQNAKEFMEAITMAAKGELVPGLEQAPAGGGDDEATMVADDAATMIDPGATVANPDAGGATVANPAGATVANAAAGGATVVNPAGGAETVVNPAATQPPPAAEKKGGSGVMIGVIVALLAVGGGGGWWFMNQKSSAPEAQSAVPAATTAPTATAPAATTEPADDILVAPAEKMGIVEVISTPKGAVIQVAGEFMGVTPQRFEHAVGSHQVIIRKRGYDPIEATLDVIEGEITSIDLELEPLPDRAPGG
ncbi:MAG: serine/threonine protein kinase [Magnetococcales bacterium]|nr:serine/threonine protein kinase [Magnetococcales bacterium]